MIAALTHATPIRWETPLVLALVYNAVLASGLAWLMWSYVVENVPANVAGLSSLAVPIAGIGFAWVLLGERPSLAESIGIALIASALLLVNLRRRARAG